jgi:hypothetical protein
MPDTKHEKRRLFIVTVIIVMAIGTPLYIYYYPHIIYTTWENSIISNGFGITPNATGIPANSLYTSTTLASPSTQNNVAGANHDVLYTIGVLDLSKGPQILHVPDMDGRYYSVEFVNPWGDPFYVGQRTTGTGPGDYLISGPGWKGNVSAGLTQYSASDNRLLVVGRVLVYNESDLSTAYDLSKQIQVMPLA